MSYPSCRSASEVDSFFRWAWAYLAWTEVDGGNAERGEARDIGPRLLGLHAVHSGGVECADERTVRARGGRW